MQPGGGAWSQLTALTGGCEASAFWACAWGHSRALLWALPRLWACTATNAAIHTLRGQAPSGRWEAAYAYLRALATIVLLQLPEWWLKLLAELTTELLPRLQSDVWRRKRLRAWPAICAARVWAGVRHVGLTRLGRQLDLYRRPGFAWHVARGVWTPAPPLA